MNQFIESILIILTRVIPFKKVYSLAWRYSEALVKRQKNQKREAKSQYGFSILGQLDDYLFRSIYFTGKYEQEIFDILDNQVSNDQVWYDLGSNIGYYSLYLASKAKQVVAVDANPDLAELLNQAKTINKFKNLTIVNKAISDVVDQKIEFYLATADLGRSSAIKYNDIANTKKIEVKTTTVDQMVSDKLPLPYGIKIDIEGLEINALKGSVNLLKNHPPKMIIMELSQRAEVLAQPQEIINFLEGFKYKPYLIRGQSLVPVSSENKLDIILDPNVFFISGNDSPS